MLDDAQTYLQRALELMEAICLVRHSVPWEDIKREVKKMATGAAVTSDVYPAVRHALARLGDGRSL